MDVLRWFGGGDYVPGVWPDVLWSGVTAALSASIAAGYGVIAVKWYFQAKVDRRSDARAALARLRNVVLGCGACGYLFFALDMGWAAWRLYDAALVVLAVHTWSFALRARGMGLVDDRLARVAELEASAQKYREIAELLPHAVWTATADGRVDFSNRRWADYAGEGRPWTAALHPDEREAVRAWWDQARAAGRPVSREVRLAGAGPDAGYRSFVLSATPVRRGDAVKWLGACADVDDQRRAAAEREAQARQKAFFLNALSHDLRAPLNNVVLNAHLLKMSAPGTAGAEVADVIIENALAAGNLVTDLLDFARAGEAPAELRAAPVPLAATLRQVVRRFQPLAQKKGLSLQFNEGRGGDAQVVTDRLKLERVLSNLVDNAIKYTDRGGVTLAVVAPAPGDDGAVRVHVCDTGIGVPPGDVSRLFDEFYQVNNHERDRGKGFGMGLAICRCFARQLGGDVRLADTGPGGSRFELTLPVGAAADRRGRLRGAAGDPADPQGARLCHV